MIIAPRPQAHPTAQHILAPAPATSKHHTASPTPAHNPAPRAALLPHLFVQRLSQHPPTHPPGRPPQQLRTHPANRLPQRPPTQPPTQPPSPALTRFWSARRGSGCPPWAASARSLTSAAASSAGSAWARRLPATKVRRVQLGGREGSGCGVYQGVAARWPCRARRSGAEVGAFGILWHASPHTTPPKA